MADDSISYEVITDYVNRGLTTAVSEIDQMVKALDRLNAQGKVTEASYRKLSRSLETLNLRVAAGEVKTVSAEFAGLVRTLDATTAAFQRQAQAQRSKGSLTPTQGAISGYSVAALKEYIATDDALNASFISNARQQVAATEAVATARKNLYAAQGDAYFAKQKQGMTEVQAATVDYTRAQNLLATATKEVAVAQKTRDPRAIAAAIDNQTSATVRLSQADNALVAAQARVAKSTGAFHAQLPRLRYALYDIGFTAGIAGAALAAMSGIAFATAIRMDKEFANVIRTSQTTGAAAEHLRDQFDDLFTSIPVGWSDLTQIGTLGGQLGIAANDLAEFTELVAKFSATTNVSVEDAATAFGRLSKLLDVPAAQFENLGSSILKVGVNSVATESQIISISSQIASIATIAGLSADEVVGLSGALASLGVQPELSRGTITRLFANIASSIASGSTRLEEFGRITGQTGQEFATAWGSDAIGTLQTLLATLGQMSNTEAITTLKDLGITAARDIPTVLKLAQNTDVLKAAIDDASSGFADGTTLNEQYGVIAQTTAAKLQVLGNAFKEFLASAGESANSGFIQWVIGGLTELVKIAAKLNDNPVASWIIGITLGLTGLIGVGLLAVAAMTRFSGSLIALETAGLEYRKLLEDLAARHGILTVSTNGTALSNKALLASLRGVEGGLVGMTGAARAATIAINGLKIASGIGILLLGIDLAFAAFAGHADDASLALTTFRGSLDDALSQDAANKDDPSTIFRNMASTAPDATAATEDLGKAVNDSALEFSGLHIAADDTTQSLTDMMVAMGAVTDQAVSKNIADLLLGDSTDPEKQRQNIERIKDGLFDLGVSVEDIKTAIKTGDTKFFDDLIAKTSTSATNFGFLDQRTQNAYNAVNTFAKGARDSTDAMTVAAQQYLVTGDAASTAGVAASEGADGVEDFTQAIKDSISAITDALNGTISLQNSLYGLGQSLADNGNNWSEFSAAGRENLGSLLGVMDAIAAQSPGDAQQIASNFQALYEMLIKGGFATAQQLYVIQEAIQSLKAEGGFTSLTTPTIDLSSVMAGYATNTQKAADKTANLGKAARNTAKEIRTLKDYVSDLKSVFSDAFDFRFGLGQAKDEVTSTIHSISDGFADAKQKVRDLKLDIQDLQATLTGLGADKSTLEYQLKVALEYGDALRANEIQAKLAENASDTAKAQADLTDKQKDLTKAQEDATPTLTGNTDAAIEQREEVLKLVQSYEDMIAAYAAQGHTQGEVAAYAKKLKGQLDAQLTAWGYNKSEVKKYTGALDDAVKIINKVPRNLTIKADADTDPAQKALDIFFSKNKDKTITTTHKVVTNYTTSGKKPTDKELRARAIGAQIDSITAQISYWSKQKGNTAGILAGLGTELKRLQALLKSGKYYSGGFTGRGGKYEPAGIVHKGEYVVPKEQVNQATGLPYAGAMGLMPKQATSSGSYASGGAVTGGGIIQVELSPRDYRALVGAGNATITVNGRVLADVVNGINQNDRTRGK